MACNGGYPVFGFTSSFDMLGRSALDHAVYPGRGTFDPDKSRIKAE
jgi:hypothetical protein